MLIAVFGSTSATVSALSTSAISRPSGDQLTINSGGAPIDTVGTNEIERWAPVRRSRTTKAVCSYISGIGLSARYASRV